MSADNISVKVAVRIRPLVISEINKGCKEVLDVVTENEQVIIKGSDKAFTFNYVLDSGAPQDELYNRCVRNMINNLFKGYNITILAYGQTGSGKTHSMGTAYKGDGDMGVIPSATKQIFEYIKDNFSLNFTITVSFLELYQEVLYDLLSGKPREHCALEIREDVKGNIIIPGLTEVPVNSANEILEQLAKGSQGRVTGATNMNSQSSRSHAIFTINMCMQNKENCKENKTAKLHLVDLAGSERPKKTGAVGNTFKEGVNINKGLFVLGNVISCLGDESKSNPFVPYRDSNLTRLLKDSLGGNSITLMIACVSPADYNLEETLSTLRYADRARKIKNKPIVNEDPKVAEINALKKVIKDLRLQIVGQGGPVICPAEIELLKKENADKSVKIRDLTKQISEMLNGKTYLLEKMMVLQTSNEALTKKIQEIKNEYDVTFTNISMGIEKNDIQIIKDNISHLQTIQTQFVDINTEQEKLEKEIGLYEEASCINRHSTGDAPEIHEQQETHTTRQMELNTKLDQISEQLILKQNLAKQIATNTGYMVDYNGMAENEDKIATLEKEKDELLNQLKTAQSQGASGKIAESRRKRVQELEAQIHDLKKKVQEQARLIKMKDKDEERIKNLNQDIVQLKQTKVRLIRSMKDENDKFRQWKMQRERELARLKQEDRKKENKIVKMQAMHTKQQNVFKRKVEEAAALNKRLKDALALRKQAQEQKISGKIERIGPWLKQELDVFVNLVEAEATLTALLEDRATLQQHLDELKSNPDMADSPECKAMEEDMELRTIQIQDLQQKILDSDEENKAKVRFDNIQTMGEAKFALRTLFEQTAEIKKKQVQSHAKSNELLDALNEVKDKLDKVVESQKYNDQKNAEQIAELQSSYEEKIAVLLRQLRGVKVEDIGIDKELKDICEIQHEKIDSLEKENKDLKEKLEEIRKIGKDCATPVIIQKEKMTKSEIPKVTVDVDMLTDEEADTSLELDVDDNKKDPDWRKTPLGKRILAEKRRLTHSIVVPSERLTVKRSSEGGCTCKGKCTRCVCRKMSKPCGSSCKCGVECTNKNATNSISEENLQGNGLFSGGDSDTSESNDSFKKPINPENVELVKRPRKKTRQLFNL